jgi:hypothetical protein
MVDVDARDVKHIKSRSAPNSPQQLSRPAPPPPQQQPPVQDEHATKVANFETRARQELQRFLNVAHFSLLQCSSRADRLRQANSFLMEVFALSQTTTEEATDVQQFMDIVNREVWRVVSEDHVKMLQTSNVSNKSLPWKLGVLYAQGFNRWIRHYSQLMSSLPQMATQLFPVSEILLLRLPRVLRL